jgi:MEMO1 family protein
MKLRPNIGANVLYPGDKHELVAAVETYLNSNTLKETRTEEGVDLSDKKIKALLVPHSGYEYSGELLGQGYRLVENQTVDEVFLLGVTHFSDFEGALVSTFSKWETPMGYVEQSHRTDQIIGSDDNKAKDILRPDQEKHLGEHSIEVQLPFVKSVSKQSRVVPILVDEISPRLMADSLSGLIDKDDLLVGAVELSQGFPKDYAEVLDATSIDAISDLDTDRIMNEKFQSTGSIVIGTIVEIAKIKDWNVGVINYKNSAETDGNEDKTVGRMCIAFFE